MREYIQKVISMNKNAKPITLFIYGALFFLLVYMIGIRLFTKPEIFIIIVALYVAIVFHEVAHGYVAYLMGDKTAKIAGRLTLNPMKHIDPMGLLIPIVLIFMNFNFVIGWAKPVPISYRLIDRKKNGLFFVAIAGVTVNFIIAFIAATVLKFFPFVQAKLIAFGEVLGNPVAGEYNFFDLPSSIALFFVYLTFINVGLGIFNLIPIPPLDGSKILESFVSSKVNMFFRSIEKYGFVVLIVLMWTGLLYKLIGPVFNLVINIILKYVS